jgi:hypothetical protein
MQSETVRKNGLSKPHHPYQIISWVLTVSNFLICSISIMPLIDYSEMVNLTQISFIILYYLSQILLLLFAYMVTKMDPTDSVVYQHLQALKKG